jgi:hypothetical protein
VSSAKSNAGGHDIDRRLDAYEAQARAGAGRGHLACWPTYAAAVGSGLAFATAADADIIYSGTQNLKAGPINTNPVQYGFFRSSKTFFIGTVKFAGGVEVAHGANKVHAAFLASGGFSDRVEFLDNTRSGFLKRLASGAMICSGAAGTWATNGQLVNRHTTSGVQSRLGTWPPSVTGFAGVRFFSTSSHLGPATYGWVRLIWEAGPGGNPASLTVIDWAYETDPNVCLNAGQGIPTAAPPVPEPGTLSLMLLALGSPGFPARTTPANKDSPS